MALVAKSNVNAFQQRTGYDIIPAHPLERLRPLQVDVELRKSTFTNWPKHSIMSPRKLYNNGFYYMGINDKVQCAFCGGVLSDWERDDDVEKEHARHFGQCELVKVRKESRHMLNSEIEKTKNLSSSLKPHNRNYILYSDRVDSYERLGWSKQNPHLPKDLAETGLFYTGTGDKCKCYMCGGVLSNWESSDVPKEEHQRWFPKCPLFSN